MVRKQKAKREWFPGNQVKKVSWGAQATGSSAAELSITLNRSESLKQSLERQVLISKPGMLLLPYNSTMKKVEQMNGSLSQLLQTYLQEICSLI